MTDIEIAKKAIDEITDINNSILDLVDNQEVIKLLNKQLVSVYTLRSTLKSIDSNIKRLSNKFV